MTNREILESMASMVPALGSNYSNPTNGLFNRASINSLDVRRRKLPTKNYPTNSRNTRSDIDYSSNSRFSDNQSPWSGSQYANWLNSNDWSGEQMAQWLNSGTYIPGGGS